MRAISIEGRGGGVTSTDTEGRFEIKELPAGRYNVSASKGGFVTGQFGQRRPGEPGTPIDLAEGQTAEKVNFALSRGSVISGTNRRRRWRAGVGNAGRRRCVTQFVAGARRLVPGGGEGSTDRTDDQGGFRLYGLPPGDYFISANNRSNHDDRAAGINNTEADGFAPTYFPGTPNLSEADAHHREGRTGNERRELRADRRAHGARPRPRPEFARRAGGERHADADACDPSMGMNSA